jgi:hypothetical protein
MGDDGENTRATARDDRLSLTEDCQLQLELQKKGRQVAEAQDGRLQRTNVAFPAHTALNVANKRC